MADDENTAPQAGGSSHLTSGANSKAIPALAAPRPGPLANAQNLNRRSSLTGLSDDLAKLRSEFDVLQQQLQTIPTASTRRESLIGAGAAATARHLLHDNPACPPLPPLHPPAPPTHTAISMPQPNIAPKPPAAPQAALDPSSQQLRAPSWTMAAPISMPEPPAPASQPALPTQPLPSLQQSASLQTCSSFSAPAVDLVSRVNSLADCPLGNLPGRNEALFHITCTAPANSQTWKAASETLLDPELTALCEEGLNKQLTRTKDGATEASRIQELAGLVKLLRKAVRELASRSCMYVEQCMRLEREQANQVETIKLSTESATRALQAELAAAKKAQAGWEAAQKADKATWGADLESSRFEAARLKRELERVTQERDVAREDVSRAEQLRQHAEQELKELRKSSSQQIREVAMSQGEAVRSISDEKAAVEKREAALKEDVNRLSQRLDAANVCIEAMQSELALLQQVHQSVKDALKAKAAIYDTLTEQHALLQAQRNQLDEQVAGLSSQCAAQQHDLETASGTLQQVQQQLASVQAAQQAAEQEVVMLREQLQEARQQLDEQSKELEAAKAGASALKAALSAELEHRERLTSALSTSQREGGLMANEITNLKHQLEFAAGLQQDAESKAASAEQVVAQLQQDMQEQLQRLTSREERLAVLEGEFEALTEVLGDAGGQKDVVTGLLTRISTLQAAVSAAEATRRKLHNELVTLRGNIRVYCRVRPHASPVVKCGADKSSIAISVDSKEHSFTFDQVYAPQCSQEEVFEGVSELIQSALDGYHVCLFSYGQTGAGKTFTMQGCDSPVGRGIIPRAVEKILATAAHLESQAEWQYSMEASFIEVYNNSLRDLLGGPSAPYINDQSAIKHDPAGGHTTVVGMTKAPVADAAAAHQLVRRATANRACEATAMNAESSRSHVVFMLYIKGSHPPSGTNLQGCLCLVDLAGSERLDRSQAEDARKKEACAINQSLSALGDVFASLSTKNTHIPYRNSKLTYLLQPCLGGQGKTLMFVNINPEPASAYESLCSLKFASKVNGCELGGKGGARRAASTSAGPVAAAGGAARSAIEDAKRLSLPGPSRAVVGAPSAEQSKRMSMYGGGGSTGANSSGGAGVGSKRSPASAAGHVAKRAKQ